MPSATELRAPGRAAVSPLRYASWVKPAIGDCPDDDLVAAYVGGTLPGEEVRRFEAHMDGCPACHRVAAALAQAETSDRPREPEPLASVGDASAASAWPAPGTQLRQFRVHRLLGRGGMSAVYAAHDENLGRDVALKIVGTRGVRRDHRLRLIREARMAARLRHPSIVTVYEIGEVDSFTYLAMELVEGQPLRALVEDDSIPFERRIDWLVDTARALAAAHGQGLVHRDIKPDNVMIRHDGVVKVVDFGIARPIDPVSLAGDPAITREGTLVGTPVYMAPEQLRGEPVDARADVFAWGVMAYELVARQRPWVSEGTALVSAILEREPPELPPPIPRAVDRAIRRAMAKSPERRFSSITDAANALAPFWYDGSNPNAGKIDGQKSSAGPLRPRLR